MKNGGREKEKCNLGPSVLFAGVTNYRKITKISPGTYFLKALFEGLIYGEKVAFQNRLG